VPLVEAGRFELPCSVTFTPISTIPFYVSFRLNELVNFLCFFTNFFMARK
jgi:hypothetical protein